MHGWVEVKIYRQMDGWRDKYIDGWMGLGMDIDGWMG